MGTPSAPALVADSLTATSLSLEWEIPPRLAKFTKGSKSFLVQWRYEEVRGDWKFCRNHSIGDNSTVRVDNLQPYTKYRVWQIHFFFQNVWELHFYISFALSFAWPWSCRPTTKRNCSPNRVSSLAHYQWANRCRNRQS